MKEEVLISKEYFHNKIVILNIALTFIIVLLHSTPLNRLGIDNENDYFFIHAVDVFSQIGVPMFFFISAMLFYKNVSQISVIASKLKRRIKTLLVPYLLWNMIFVALYWVMTHIHLSASMMNMQPVPSSLRGLFVSVLDSKYTVLWFVKDLIVFSLLSPVFYMLLKNKMLALLCIIWLICLNVHESMGYENVFHWMPVYLLGAMVGYNKWYKITPPENIICS